jgi:hypothetical protein
MTILAGLTDGLVPLMNVSSMQPELTFWLSPSKVGSGSSLVQPRGANAPKSLERWRAALKSVLANFRCKRDRAERCICQIKKALALSK